MEIVEVALTEFTRRSRSLVVDHAALGLARPLEYGERVLVLDGGDYRAAVVVDLDLDPTGTRYRLVIGGRVHDEVARALLSGKEAAPTAGRVSVHHLGDAIARSTQGGRIPMQRRAAERLLAD